MVRRGTGRFFLVISALALAGLFPSACTKTKTKTVVLEPEEPQGILLSIAVAPFSATIAQDTALQLTAVGIYDDHTVKDVTAEASWKSSEESLATVGDSAGTKGLATALAAGKAVITASLDDVSGSASLTVTEAKLVSIQVTPTAPSIAVGTRIQLAATGIFDDQTSQDLTAAASWSSSDDLVATVGNGILDKGLASAVAIGAATISAEFGGATGSTSLTVTPAVLVAIELSPLDPVIAAGTSQQMAATGIFDNHTTQDLTAQVTWTSSAADVAEPSGAAGSEGLVTGKKEGTAAIEASLDGVAGSVHLVVTPARLLSIAIAPENASIARGTKIQLAATGSYSDGSVQDLTSLVSWEPSAPGQAAVVSNAPGSKGLAAGDSEGTATVTAALGSASGSTALTVTGAVLESIAVSAPSPSIEINGWEPFQATGTFSDGTEQDLTNEVTWTSSDTSVAEVSNEAGAKGLATALALGSTTISAALDGKTGSATLVVCPEVLVSISVDPKDMTISFKNKLFIATGTYSDGRTLNLSSAVTWSSSDEDTIFISNAQGSKGFATARTSGTVVITATLTLGYGTFEGSTTLTVNLP